MTEEYFVPPHIRTSEAFPELFDEEELETWLSDIENFDAAVLMGVPESEAELFAEESEQILGHESLGDADIYAYEDIGEKLGTSYSEIDHEGSPSRIGDIEWMNEYFGEDRDIAVISFDYNVRTGLEIDRRIDGQETHGQFASEFRETPDFSISNYVKGLFPWNRDLFEPWEISEEDLSYSMSEADDSNVVVFNARLSDDIDDYRGKMRSEAFRHGLASLPYGQKMKDIGKRGLSRVLGGFDY